MLVKIGQKIIYPGHGLAVIKEKLTNPGSEIVYLKLGFPFVRDMEVLIPEERVASTNIRGICSPKEIQAAIKLLEGAPDKIESYYWQGHKTWKKRQKLYRDMIDGGLLSDIAIIYKNLWHSSMEKELPFGEKDMLNRVESLFCQEVFASKHPNGVDLNDFIIKIREKLASSVELIKKSQDKPKEILANL